MSDPRSGGDLSDMAASGTSIPDDAGTQRTIPSKPRPDQISDNTSAFSTGGIGAGDTAGAADNASDMPRRNMDIGATGEVITGTGDQLPPQIESKNLHYGPNDPLSKGHDRYDKHTRQKESDFERYQGEGATADPVPGEEEDSQDTVRDRKGL